MAPQLNDILRLTLLERIQWAEALWNSIAIEDAPSTYDLSVEQKNFLREEMEDYQRNPDAGMTWEDAKEKIRKG